MASSPPGSACAAQISISCLTNKLTLQQPQPQQADGKEQHHLTKTVLTISSATNAGPMALKIRTTRPKRYLVRPNQGMLAPGEKLEVSIIMSAEKQSEALEEVTRSLPSAYTDKFQVVYVGMEKSLYASLVKSVDAQEQADMMKQFWDHVDSSIILKKTFELELVLPPSRRQATAVGDVGEGNGHVFPPVLLRKIMEVDEGFEAATSMHGACASPSTLAGETHLPFGSTNETADYRKRYDELVTSTVALTGERDMLLNALDTLKLELRREMACHNEHRGGAGSLTGGGSVRQDQLSLHKRRSSKASSFSSVSTIPGIASHGRGTPSSSIEANHIASGSGSSARHGKHNNSFRSSSSSVNANTSSAASSASNTKATMSKNMTFSFWTVALVALVAFVLGNALRR